MQITAPVSQITSWLDSGYRLGAGQFTFSVPGPASIWPQYGYADEIGGTDFALPDSAMAAAFIKAVSLWDELIAPDFTQVADNAASRGELRIGITDMANNQSAYAFYPAWSGGKPGDIWFNPDFGPWDWQEGGFDLYTMIHEVGHAIGLEHSFDAPVAPVELDTHRHTVMSYTELEQNVVSFGYNDGEFFGHFRSPEPETPMVLDIAAVQEIYGADPDTRVGDTVYTFRQFSPSMETIYDAGGNDTIDMSDFFLPGHIDLRPGAYSSIGQATNQQQIDHWAAQFPEHASFIAYVFESHLAMKDMVAYDFTQNLGIALSAVIENARGGSGDDILTGNAADNVLIGNSGDDELIGRSGSDRLEGGEGNDVLRGDSDFAIVQASAELTGRPEPEVVSDTPFIGLRLSGPAPSGSLLIIDSQSAPPASLPIQTPPPAPLSPYDLGEGDDVLDGGPGQDTLSGGAGADLFLFDDGDFAGLGMASADRITDFAAGEGDRIDLSAIDALTGGLDDPFRFIGQSQFSGQGGELRFSRHDDGVLVTGEVNGDLLADFAIRLDDLSAISANAFIL